MPRPSKSISQLAPIVLAYTRVSSDETRTSRTGKTREAKQANGLHAQADVIARSPYAECEVIAENFTGTRLDRPKFQDVLRRLCERPGSTLVVTTTDRLGRREVDMHVVIDHLRRCKVRLVVLDISTEPLRDADLLNLSIRIGFAAEERRKIAARTSAALQVLKSQGVQLGHPSTVDIDELRSMREDGRTQAQLAAHFRVTQQTVSRLLRKYGIR